MPKIVPPSSGEYSEFYAGYVARIGDADVLQVLETQIAEIESFSAQIGEENKNFAYAKGKWTIAEVFGHLIDTERVFVYRAMRFARGDTNSLNGFDQDWFVAQNNTYEYSLAELTAEFSNLRRANLSFFRHLKEIQLNRRGTASGAEVSVRALVFMTAGHVAHHLTIFRERYLNEI